MKILYIVPIIAALALASGCNNHDSRADLARLEQQMAALQAENERLNDEVLKAAARKQEAPQDIDFVLRRLEQAETRLKEAEARLAALNAKPAVADEAAQTKEEPKADEDAYTEFKAMQDRYNEEREAERQARRIERQGERQAQMQEFARRAKEAGLEFDPQNPRESGMQIWMDPAKREKAMKVAVDMFNDQRLAPLKLDDRQKTEVLRIEAEARKKVKDITAAGREGGATPEEIAKQVDTARKETEGELQRTMTQEQYEEYKKTAAEGAAMPGTIEELGGMIPPGMLPGFGGGQGGGQGR